MSRTAKKTSKPKGDRFARRMGQVCLIGLGGFIAWAGFVPLEEGVGASGVIVVESNRQVVQHLEGGIIEEIAVRDGDWVTAGDTLVILQETASLALRDEIGQDIAALTAAAARLHALQVGDASIDFIGLSETDVGQTELIEIRNRETELFVRQQEALDADIAVLASQRNSAQTRASLRQNEIEITRRAVVGAQEELELISGLYDQQLTRRDQVIELERRLTTLDGTIARLQSEQTLALAEARSFANEITQRQAAFAEGVAAELRTVSAELQAAEERLSTAQDVLDRGIITAPVSGEVLNLAFSTRGGVIAPGETVLEIVPSGDIVIASVHVNPTDRAQVFEGLNVRTQVSAFRSWRSPSLEGIIEDVSADLKRDPITGAAYYEARIRVELPSNWEAESQAVTPGMPVDAFIFSGKSRTTLDYLFEPIQASIFKGLRQG